MRVEGLGADQQLRLRLLEIVLQHRPNWKVDDMLHYLEMLEDFVIGEEGDATADPRPLDHMRPFYEADAQREAESSRRFREIEQLHERGLSEVADRAHAEWRKWREESGIALEKIREECEAAATPDPASKDSAA